MNAALIAVGIIIVLIIIIAFIIWLRYPKYTNNVLNVVYSYNNWTDGTTPYTFLILPNNQLQLAYYDSAGYLKGFTTLIFNYIAPDNNTLTLNYASTTVDYSKSARTYPWTLKYISAQQLTLVANGVNHTLSIF